jgi:hypothetical protein
MENLNRIEKVRKERELLLSTMDSMYLGIDRTMGSILKDIKAASASKDDFEILSKINGCKKMIKSSIDNFRVGMRERSDFLCIINHELFSRFYLEYLDYKNELVFRLAGPNPVKGGEKNEEKTNK